DKKAYKCTLCSDRVGVGLEPACVKTCPTGAIVFGTKDDMKQHAAERIEDLKSRGFDQAGLYDPAGVGGTHVMYVLHHADQPGLYAGLAPDPHISALVGLRSEEHTSELQSRFDLVCRLLLEKKKEIYTSQAARLH